MSKKIKNIKIQPKKKIESGETKQKLSGVFQLPKHIPGHELVFETTLNPLQTYPEVMSDGLAHAITESAKMYCRQYAVSNKTTEIPDRSKHVIALDIERELGVVLKATDIETINLLVARLVSFYQSEYDQSTVLIKQGKAININILDEPLIYSSNTNMAYAFSQFDNMPFFVTTMTAYCPITNQLVYASR